MRVWTEWPLPSSNLFLTTFYQVSVYNPLMSDTNSSLMVLSPWQFGKQFPIPYGVKPYNVLCGDHEPPLYEACFHPGFGCPVESHIWVCSSCLVTQRKLTLSSLKINTGQRVCHKHCLFICANISYYIYLPFSRVSTHFDGLVVFMCTLTSSKSPSYHLGHAYAFIFSISLCVPFWHSY